MHVLVTGSAGRIGRRVVALLLERGDRVTAFDAVRGPGSHSVLRHVEGAFEDERACFAAAEGAEAVLHLGAFMSWLPEDAARVHAANVTGTFNLLRASARSRARRFVLASSG